MQTLSADGCEARFDLESGARLASLRVDDLELLVAPDNDLMRWGSYPMAPWAGRIAGGRFVHEGERHQLPLNLAPNAIHGTVFETPWPRDGASWSEREGSMSIELTSPWPYPGRLEQRATLGATGLLIELSLTAGDRSMPAMLGWHPWFRRTVGGSHVLLDLDLQAASMFELDEAMIPTGRLIPPSDPPWDNTFVGLGQTPTLRWPGVLDLELRSTCRYWTIYTEPDHAVCVEPQTAAPDAFNRASGPSSADEAVLAPGATMAASFEMIWHRPTKA